MIALVFRYDVHEVEAFEAVYGPEGAWAQFFRSGEGYIGTELLAAHQEEYLRRSDEARFHYSQELRFGTFENIWHADSPAP